MSLSPGMEALCNSNSAALGGLIATGCTYFIDTINKKMITEGESNAFAVAMKFAKEGRLQGPH